MSRWFSFPPAALFAAQVPPFGPLDPHRPRPDPGPRPPSTFSISQHLGYADIFFTSNPSADWFDAAPPYAEHQGGKIRIHAILASPLVGGPYPAIVIGHGHHGHADGNLALLVASLGYVALAIDGPEAGQSTGGPEDENQAWISVDKGPQYSYLYHYAYAGMRALTLLERLASYTGEPLPHRHEQVRRAGRLDGRNPRHLHERRGRPAEVGRDHRGCRELAAHAALPEFLALPRHLRLDPRSAVQRQRPV